MSPEQVRSLETGSIAQIMDANGSARVGTLKEKCLGVLLFDVDGEMLAVDPDLDDVAPATKSNLYEVCTCASPLIARPVISFVTESSSPFRHA